MRHGRFKNKDVINNARWYLSLKQGWRTTFQSAYVMIRTLEYVFVVTENFYPQEASYFM